MLIGVSTGVLNQFIKGKNEQIRFFKESGLEIDGIEISFGTPDDVEPLSKENEKYVRGLGFSTIHLPFRNIEYSETETPLLKALSKAYSRLGSKIAVVHPDNVKSAETYGYLQKLFPGLSVENMTPRKNTGRTIKELKSIIDKNKKLGVVLDFAHCMETEEPFSAYEKAFFDRIAEIHISARRFSGAGSMHALLHKTETMPIIRKRDVPLILEGKITSKEELEKELSFAKKL